MPSAGSSNSNSSDRDSKILFPFSRKNKQHSNYNLLLISGQIACLKFIINLISRTKEAQLGAQAAAHRWPWLVQLIVFATAAVVVAFASASVGRLLAPWDLLATHCLRLDCSAAVAATSVAPGPTSSFFCCFFFFCDVVLVFYNSRARQLTRSAYGPFDQIEWSTLLLALLLVPRRCCPLAAMISNLNFYCQHLQIMLQRLLQRLFALFMASARVINLL